MSVRRYTLDTNLLVYALDNDAGEKHTRAIEVIDGVIEQDCVLTVQALGEFFHAVTRKGKMPLADAAAQVHDWLMLFPTVAAGSQDLSHAIAAVQRYQLAFWDALLWATAKTAGVTVVLSEDFQDGRELEGLLFWNPFVHDPFLPQ